MADGEIVVEVRAGTSDFDKKLRNSRQQAGKFDKAATKTARGGAKKLNDEARKGARAVDKYQTALKRTADSAALLTGPLGGIASRLSILGRVTSVSAAALLGFSVAVGAVTVGLSKAISEAEKFQTSGLRVQAVIKATGSSAGITAQEIRELSEAIALSTLASTEGVEAAAAKLLTFRSIQGDTFREALRLSQDLAELGFGSIESGVVRLGRALEDPISGLTALTRLGVTFTAGQKEQIRRFVELNQLARAQAIVLGEVNKISGVGEAVTQGLAGAYDTLGQRVSEFLQDIGNAGPVEFMTNAIKGLTRGVVNLNALLFDSPADKIQELLAARQKITEAAQDASPLLAAAAKNQIAAINAEIAALQNKRVEEIKASAAAREAAKAFAAASAEEARLSKIIEAQAKERERLSKLRETTKRGITEEVAALQQLSAAYVGSSLSAKEFALLEQRITTLSKLNLDATSKEGKEISALIAERMRLTETIARERSEREQDAATNARLQALQTETEATQILMGAIGKSAAVTRAAKVEAKAHRIEQELTTAALQKQETLSARQTEAIRSQAQALAEATVKLEDFQDAQGRAQDAEEEANAKRLEFQETLSSGITDLLFETGSVEDALKGMILQLSRAIVQAQIFKAIQSASGGGGGFFGAVAGVVTGATSTDTTTAARMHSGGSVGSAGQPISVPSSNFINAPRFHNGLKPDEFPAILQQGEEVIPKDQVGNRPQGGRDIVFNISAPDPNAFRKSQRQISRNLRQATAAT